MTVREFFDPRTRGSTWRTEALAGVTTFMTMAYPWVWALCGLFAAGYAASFFLPSGWPPIL